MKRYALRFGTTRIPMVEILLGQEITHRCYGFTTQHAYRRALSWARQNGDPR